MAKMLDGTNFVMCADKNIEWNKLLYILLLRVE